MRMLLTCVSGHSHLHNVVPLATAARELGHEVAVSSAAELAPLARKAGLTLIPSGPGRLRVRTEMTRVTGQEPPTRDVRDWRGGARMFGDVIPRLRWGQLEAVVREYRPDVIVNESLDWAAPLVARLRGVPSVTHSIGPYYRGTYSLLWQHAQPLYRKHLGEGVRPADVIGPYLDICPAPLQSAAGRGVRMSIPVRLRAYHGPHGAGNQVAGNQAAGNHHAPRGDGGAPRVLITFGTVANDTITEMDESAALLARSGMDILMTRGPRGWFDWTWSTGTEPVDGRPAGQVCTVDYAPLHHELPATSVLIHHGGSNTMRAALEYGVPQLVIPHGAEQYRNACWITRHGLGRMMMPSRLRPRRILAEVRTLLSDGTTARRMAAARAAWLAMPDPELALDQIARHVARTTGTDRPR